MIGRPVRRREDLPLVRGHGRYVDDVDLPCAVTDGRVAMMVPDVRG